MDTTPRRGLIIEMVIDMMAPTIARGETTAENVVDTIAELLWNPAIARETELGAARWIASRIREGIFTTLRADCRDKDWPDDHPYWTYEISPEGETPLADRILAPEMRAALGIIF